ncbi:MAG: sugar phosphate isomerase/epimerase [Cytophagales bacterium]|nr:sugar phosphate isomerase/epimerase [Armatimonadota bacterium]
MRFGVCAGVDKAPLLAEAGYDYIELAVGGDLVPDEDEAAWGAKRPAIEALPLPVESFNSFVRKGRIVGPDADFDWLERYVRSALSRAAQVGGKIIVFGSGGARRVPDGVPRDEAERQILRFLHLCADASERTGVVVAIEPLNRAESNIINSVAEGARLVKLVDRPGVRNLADSYHMEKDDEPVSAVQEFGEVLAHVHTADTERGAPGTGVYDHSAFFRELRAVGYDSRVSIECSWKDLAAEAGPALAHLKRAWADAGSPDT